MKVTYFVEIMSSWCLWAEPAWTQLKSKYAGRAEFDWKIALMRPEDFPASARQNDWFYQRSGTVMRSPFKLNSGWVDPALKGNYRAPNYVAEAGKDMGVTDDRLRLALSQAAMREGRRIGSMDEAIAVASQAVGLDGRKLRSLAESPEVQQRVHRATEEFFGLKINQRPAFLLEDPIGDRAVFSGLVALSPLEATLDAMLADSAAYASYAAHFGSAPQE